jgi:hypothetical protein
MRLHVTKDWPKFLGAITSACNHSVNRGLSFYASPSEINDIAFDPYVRMLRSLIRHSKSKYKSVGDIYKPGDYVYLDYPPAPMMKG